uniref:glucuronosyltransferase n=1 Tax=Romanomermis culicivorax TaxID=13658 RepID=A0A915KHU2_ROMCU
MTITIHGLEPETKAVKTFKGFSYLLQHMLFSRINVRGQLGHHVTLLVDGIEGVTKKPDAKELEFVEAEYLWIKVPAEWVESRTGNFDNIVWTVDHSSPIGMIFPWKMFSEFTAFYMEQSRPEIESKLLNKRWDLVMVDALFTPFGILIGLLTNSTMASVHTTAVSNADGFRRPMPNAWSYYPTLFMPTPQYDHRKFFDRFNSFCTDLSQLFVYNMLVDSILYWHHSKHHKDISSYTLDHRSEILLVGFPTTLDYERPRARDMTPFVGSCKQRKTTVEIEDAEIRKMVEDPASKGTIVIAFGHMVTWKMAPEIVKKSFVEALNMLKDYRVIWQYSEDVESLKVGNHVKCMPWIPQVKL